MFSFSLDDRFIIYHVFIYLVLRDESGVRGVRMSLGSELDLKELLLDIVALPNLDKLETPVDIY